VFSFGSGGCGQLGHNSTQPEMMPRKVFEFMGSTVSQIACGRYIDVHAHYVCAVRTVGPRLSKHLCASDSELFG